MLRRQESCNSETVSNETDLGDSLLSSLGLTGLSLRLKLCHFQDSRTTVARQVGGSDGSMHFYDGNFPRESMFTLRGLQKTAKNI